MSSEREVPPLTESIRPGTATDPAVGSSAEATVTVDGRDVTLGPGSTLLDAVEAVDPAEPVQAVCSYDDEDLIGPRSECRTCMVDVEDRGLVPACSFPAEDGLTVRTDTERATEAREVNLDLVLSNHNLRCTTCGKNGRCDLQDAAIETGVEEPRYGVFDDRDAYEPLDDTSPFIQIDRNKCILCNRCVEACNDVQVEGVLRMEGSGRDTRIGFQSDAETMADSTCVSCGHCATVCPTGSLVETGIADAATLAIPGFSQKTSIGKTVEATGGDRRLMTPMKRGDSAGADADGAGSDGGAEAAADPDADSDDDADGDDDAWPERDDGGWLDGDDGGWLDGDDDGWVGADPSGGEDGG